MSIINKARRGFLTDSARLAAGAGLMMNAGSWNKVLGANDKVRLGEFPSRAARRGADREQRVLARAAPGTLRGGELALRYGSRF